MHDARPLSVPLDPHANLFDDSANDGPIDTEPYSPLIGSLMYAAIGTRFDIAFPTSTLAHFMVLTWDLDDSGLTAYGDADQAWQDRHSIFLYDGAAISWSSHKQALIALSPTEAEYNAAASAAREIVWLRSLVSELADLSSSPTPLRCDDQSAIALANNGLMNAQDVLISPSYVSTNDQAADLFTKALPRTKVEYFSHLLGLRPA